MNPQDTARLSGSQSSLSSDEEEPQGFIMKNPKLVPSFDLTVEQKKDMKIAFNTFDVRRTGFITVANLRIAIRALGLEPTKDEIIQLLHAIGKEEGDDQLSFNDFLRVMKIKMTEQDPDDEIKKAFQLFDESNNGFISFKDVQHVARQLGENVNDEEIKEMIEMADSNADGLVTADDFLKICKKVNLNTGLNK